MGQERVPRAMSLNVSGKRTWQAMSNERNGTSTRWERVGVRGSTAQWKGGVRRRRDKEYW